MKEIGFIGLGNMGSILFKKLCAATKTETTQGEEGKKFYLYDLDAKKAISLKSGKLESEQVIVANDLETIFRCCQCIFFAIKPNDFVNLAEEMKGFMKKEQTLISVMAGIKLSYLEKISAQPNWIRVMPNSPCLIGEGAGAMSFSKGIDDEKREIVLKWFQHLGFFFTVKEKDMDVITALTGSGPAFVFTFIQALTDAGVRWGLPRKVALKSVLHLIVGSANLVAETKKHPYLLRDEVSSPGGTTIDGLATLTKEGFETSVHQAVEHAYKKSIAISKD